VKAVVVKAGQASKLTVNYDNKPVTADITSLQIAIWNRGRLPIKRENILDSIVVCTDEKTPISDNVKNVGNSWQRLCMLRY
jgi:hypothetical protein